MYKEILNANPACALTGSHALILQGFKIKREPKDIDIYDPDNKFKIIPGMSLPKLTPEQEKEDYADSDPAFTRTAYLLEKQKVDVFYSETIKYNVIKKDGIKCVHYLDILRAKLAFVTKDSPTMAKHRNDILYFLVANF